MGPAKPIARVNSSTSLARVRLLFDAPTIAMLFGSKSGRNRRSTSLALASADMSRLPRQDHPSVDCNGALCGDQHGIQIDFPDVTCVSKQDAGGTANRKKYAHQCH